MTVGANIAELVVPSDAYGTPTFPILDWVHGKVYLVNNIAIRSYLASLTTQSPIASAFLNGGAGTAYCGDADPVTGDLVIQTSTPGSSNAEPVSKYDPTTLALALTYGTTGAIPSYPTSVWGGQSLVCVGVGTLASGGVTQVGYALLKESAFSGYVAVIRTDTMAAAGAYPNVVTGCVDSRGIMCRGASGPTKGSVFLTWDGAINGQHATLPLYTVVISPGAETYNIASWPTANPYISSATIGTIAAASIDATWTAFQCNSIGYDASDGNVLMDVNTTAAVTNKHYIIKINATTAAVMWVTAIGNIGTFGENLNLFRVDGIAISLANTAVDVITTSTGALVSSALTGLSSLSYTSGDDISGLIFTALSYTQGAGNPTPVAGTPTSFSGWAIITGPTAPPIPPIPPIPPPPNVKQPPLCGWRGQVGINWMGLALVGDRYSGVIGQSNFQDFTEYGNPMQMTITSPPIHEDRKRIFLRRFEVDVQTGVALVEGQGSDPQLMLDYSKDGGMTWDALQIWRSMGKTGEYTKRLRWINLGASRAWVLRLTCTDPVRRAIIGTYVDVAKGAG
jgi:hypothetical protein